MSALRIPREANPRISVAVVAYNAWEWTERCLRAVVQTAVSPYELLIVDNASNDGTVAGLTEIEGAVVLRNGSNVGFGVAANQAVMRARAPYVLLLNSDALVEPGWDEALAGVLDVEPDVAAVAARLLHTDGRLQEAGCVLWGDGRSDNYGDYDTPDRPEYRFRRDVDYASAACMLVRRSAFLDAGGFDTVYHPAYFEDVDLCLRLHQRGMRVVYQPRATAVHVRWASSDRTLARGLIARNQPVFMRRWAGILHGRPPRPERDDAACLLAMRDVGCAERFLVVAEDIPLDGPMGAAVETVLSGWPSSRVTVLARSAGSRAVEREALEARGVEVAAGPEATAGWLKSRRHHYTVVLLDREPSEGMHAALAESQPGAVGLDIQGSTDQLVSGLLRHGVELESPRSGL